MGLLLMCMMLLAVVHSSVSQDSYLAQEEAGCASKSGYVMGSDNCCNNYVFAIRYQLCCTDSAQAGACYCDGNSFGGMCAGEPATTTQTPTSTLCPGSPAMNPIPVPLSRMLGGITVANACTARGVVGLAAGGHQFCNAAYIKDPITGEKVLYTLSKCLESLNKAQADGLDTTGMIFEDSFALDNCTVVNSSQSMNDAVSMLSLSTLASYFVEQHLADCPSPGCLYTASTMRDHVDLNNCSIVSYGYTYSGSSVLTTASLQVADITHCSGGMMGTQCFVSPDGGASCLGDDGAPVYCSLSTGEEALYGIAAAATGCSPDNTAFNVYPISV